jgi:hypothetical protein
MGMPAPVTARNRTIDTVMTDNVRALLNQQPHPLQGTLSSAERLWLVFEWVAWLHGQLTGNRRLHPMRLGVDVTPLATP